MIVSIAVVYDFRCSCSTFHMDSGRTDNAIGKLNVCLIRLSIWGNAGAPYSNYLILGSHRNDIRGLWDRRQFESDIETI